MLARKAVDAEAVVLVYGMSCFLIAGSKPRRLYFQVCNMLVKPAGSGINFKPSRLGARSSRPYRGGPQQGEKSEFKIVDRFAVTKYVDSYRCPRRRLHFEHRSRLGASTRRG